MLVRAGITFYTLPENPCIARFIQSWIRVLLRLFTVPRANDNKGGHGRQKNLVFTQTNMTDVFKTNPVSIKKVNKSLFFDMFILTSDIQTLLSVFPQFVSHFTRVSRWYNICRNLDQMSRILCTHTS